MGVGLLYLLILTLLYGITAVWMKIALQYVDPYTLAFLRLVQGAAVLAIVYKLRGGRWAKLLRWRPWLIGGGIGVGINYILFSLGLNYTTAGSAQLVVQIQFVSLAVLAAVMLKEHLSARQVGGMICVILGIVVIFVSANDAGTLIDRRYVLGNALVFIAGIGWSIHTLANKALSKRLDSFQIVVPMLCMGTVAAGVIAAPQFEARASLTFTGLGTIVALGVLCTAGSFLLLSESLKRLSAVLVGTLISTTPLINLLLANWILGEAITASILFSAALIIAGVLAIVAAERTRRGQ